MGPLRQSHFAMNTMKNNLTMSFFDTYSLRARVTPVFVVLIPVIIAVTAWVPEGLSLKFGSAAVIVSVGLSMLVGQFGRDFGKRKEPALWKSWGGPPTTQFLRHRDRKFNSVIRNRYHRCLKKLRPDLKIPTPEQEAKDAMGADQIYGAASRYLISVTRDTKKFPLIFKENVNYGFRRNLWGLKPVGLSMVALSTLICALRLWVSYQTHTTPSVESVSGIVINFALFLLWVFWITPSTVRIAAEAYAERLLEACEQV